MTTIALIVGHADPQSFCHALARAYEDAARAAGASVTRLDLAALAFDPVLRTGHRTHQVLEPDLVRAQAVLTEAAHVVFVFPMWWASTPALVKGFIDRVFLPGFAFRYERGHTFPRKLLVGRSARLITTMDSPRLWYALGYRNALHRGFVDGTLKFVGLSPVRENVFYSVRSMTSEGRARALSSVEDSARKEARILLGARPKVAPRVLTG